MSNMALRTAATGMQAAQLRTEVIAHDIANSNTAGYKQHLLVTATLGSVFMKRPGGLTDADGTINPGGLEIGMGTKPAGIHINQAQGPAINTDNPNHIMIQGNGFFQIELPSGDIGYTRDGTFQRNAEGTMVTSDGFVLVPGIQIPENSLSLEINRSGEVFAKLAGQIEPQNLGQIELASFVNPGGLESIGSNLLLETGASGAPLVGQPGIEGFGALIQRHYEGANGNSVTSVTGLIDATKDFEFNTKVMKAAEEMSRMEASVLS